MIEVDLVQPPVEFLSVKFYSRQIPVLDKYPFLLSIVPIPLSHVLLASWASIAVMGEFCRHGRVLP